MFHNHRVNIFIYYTLTAVSLLGILYYSLIVLETKNYPALLLLLISLVIFAGVIISKLSVDPLLEHITNLQNLSKETLHELNLPISTITTNIDMIKKSLHEQKDLKRIQRIQSACDMLKERYNELDYMIKLQSSCVAHEEIELSELVQNRVDFLSPIYSHVEFELNLASTKIINDKIGLSKVIDNLIDNGIKFSQSVNKISVKLEANTLSIQDYGSGMDEVELLNIFDSYYQNNKNIRGFGIGLSMVKRFCDTNNILLNFKSKPNIGTTVTLKFKES